MSRRYEYFEDKSNYTVIDKESWDLVLAGKDGRKAKGRCAGAGERSGGEGRGRETNEQAAARQD